MRNLKKILSLALALMMILSVTASAAFTDAAKIDADYAEAVAVLNGMEVFQGYEDGSFGPTKAITRAEVAAIIYRIATADVEDDKVALYVDSTNFPDVKAADWFSGYVGYCTNAGYIKGYEDGTFQPNKTVTGFETLAMILRAMGYDAQNEFSGAAWAQNIAKIATKAGMLDTVKPGLLAGPATRELVAELLFSAVKADTVKYVPAFGYVEGLKSLGEENFDLEYVAETNDKWYRPSYGWTYKTGDEETYFNVTPVAKYTTAVTECDVAADFDFTGTKAFELYVNGVKSPEVLNALDTVDTVGAQGRETFVYDLDGTDRIVMIDTFLAKVESVADATYDARGHRKTNSTIIMTVYDGTGATKNLKLTNKGTNYPYVAGDMVLVNATTDPVSNRTTSARVNNNDGTILGLAKSEVGAQSVIWYNVGKHTINNATYADAAEFHLDEAGTDITNHTWYFDQFGNVIGATDIDTQYDYAVLKNIWWAGDATTGSGKAMGTLVYMDGTENVVVIDELESKTPKYSYVNAMTVSGDYIYVATNAATNAASEFDTQDYIKGHLFRVTTYADGAVALDKVATKTGVHTELKNSVTILNKYAHITSTDGNIGVDANTKFLVRGAQEYHSFKTYTGMNELPSFQSVKAVDYVMGSNGAADYVYIIGTTKSSTAKDFVLITNNAYAEVLYKDENGVEYYELNLPVPAEDGSIVKLLTKDPEVRKTLTSVTSVGKLFYVTYTDGYATKAEEIKTHLQYELPSDPTKFAEKLDKVALYADGVMMWEGKASWRVNVTPATVVVGELSADMTDKVVYVLYETSAAVATKIYVLDEYNGIPDVPSAGPDTLALAANYKDLKATFTFVDTNVQGGLKVFVKYRPYGSNGVWATYGEMAWNKPETNAPVYVYDLEVKLNGSYEVYAEAVLNGDVLATSGLAIVY